MVQYKKNPIRLSPAMIPIGLTGLNFITATFLARTMQNDLFLAHVNKKHVTNTWHCRVLFLLAMWLKKMSSIGRNDLYSKDKGLIQLIKVQISTLLFMKQLGAKFSFYPCLKNIFCQYNQFGKQEHASTEIFLMFPKTNNT